MLCKITSTLLQVCFFWGKMGPTWSQVGSKLAQVGVMLVQIGSKLAQDGPCWLQGGFLWKTLHAVTCPTPQVGLKLAPCWLHVGSMLAHVGSMLAHVGPSGLQDDSRCHYVGSGWPQDGQHGLQQQMLINCWSKNTHVCHVFDAKYLRIMKNYIGIRQNYWNFISKIYENLLILYKFIIYFEQKLKKNWACDERVTSL